MKKRKYAFIITVSAALLIGLSLSLPSLLQGTGASIEQKEVQEEAERAEEAEKAERAEEAIQAEEDQVVAVVEESEVIAETPEDEEATAQPEQQEIVTEPDTTTQAEATPPVAETTEDLPVEVIEEVPEEAVQDTTTWLDEQLAEYEGQIEEVDIETGVAIIEKLDMEYLNALAAEGLTGEERTAVKEHLHMQLSEDEYATALALYREYIGLLQ